MKSEKSFCARNVIINDPLANYAAIVIILDVIIFIMAMLSKTTAMISFSIAAIAIIIMAMITITIRIRRYQAILVRGQTLPAKITGNANHGNRNKLHFSFTLDGEIHKCTMPYTISKYPSQLKTGDDIDIVLEPSNPKSAFIKDLFYQ